MGMVWGEYWACGYPNVEEYDVRMGHPDQATRAN
jgi:hypothetical protein